ncbi:hypothetical protein RUM44_007979 [Polyplax serrata]|uniref:Uncharacterized protein n=1 Tax=Polyplax serrata TaxID=468196 RepID=A0ABR1B7J7_POLSC
MEKRFRGKVEMENLKIEEGEWKIKSYFCKGREEKAAVGLRQKWETDKQKEQKGWQKGTKRYRREREETLQRGTEAPNTGVVKLDMQIVPAGDSETQTSTRA